MYVAQHYEGMFKQDVGFYKAGIGSLVLVCCESFPKRTRSETHNMFISFVTH